VNPVHNAPVKLPLPGPSSFVPPFARVGLPLPGPFSPVPPYWPPCWPPLPRVSLGSPFPHPPKHSIGNGRKIHRQTNIVALIYRIHLVCPSICRGLETQIIFNKTVSPNSRAQKLFKTSSSYFLLLLLHPFPHSNCRHRWGRYFWDLKGG
jgi:hypothetical protein